MNREAAKEVTRQLERLFSAFPTAARADEVLSAKTYVAVVDGCSLEAITRSVEQFVSGRVETHDGRFAPSAAEFARNVRQWDDAIRVRDEASNPQQLASGILSVDFGNGRVDMTKLTLAQQNEVLRTGIAPAVAIGPATARLQRMTERKQGFAIGDADAEREAS